MAMGSHSIPIFVRIVDLNEAWTDSQRPCRTAMILRFHKPDSRDVLQATRKSPRLASECQPAM